MKPRSVLPRFLVIWLTLGLALPPSAHALRSQQSKDNPLATAGLESSLQGLKVEVLGDQTAGLEEPRLVMQHGAVSTFRGDESARFFFRPADQILITVPILWSDSVEVFKVPTKEPIPVPDVLQHLRLFEPRPVRFSPQGDRLYVLRKEQRDHGRPGISGKRIFILDWFSGNAEEISLELDFEVKDFEVSLDGGIFYLLGFDQRSQQWMIRSFDGKTGRKSGKDHVLPFSPDVDDYSVDVPHEFIFSPDGKGFYLRAQGGAHGRSLVHFYDMGTQSMSKPIFSIDDVGPRSYERESSLKTLAISPDGEVLYVGIPEDRDPLHDEIAVLDLQSGKIQTTAKIPGRLISIDVNPDGTLTILTGFIGGKNRQGEKFELVHVYQGSLGIGPSNAQIPGPKALITDASKAGLEETIFDETISGDDLESGKADVNNLWKSYERMRVRLQEALWQRVWRSDPVWSRFSEDVVIPIFMDERYETFDVNGYLEYSVLRHLVHNAIDAVVTRWARSPRRLQIQIRALTEGNNLKVQILDNGKGIPPEVLSVVGREKITTKNINQKISGRVLGWQGVGLFVAVGAAENHGWRLTIENRNDTQGVVASVVIPLHSGLEETAESRLKILTAAVAEKQILVINTWVVEEKRWLEQLIRQAPQEFKDKLILFGTNFEARQLADYYRIPIVASDDVEELAFELISRPEEGELQVKYLGDPVTADQVRLILPPSIHIDHIDPAAGLRELFLTLGVSAGLLDSIRIEELQGDLTRQRAA